MTEKRYSRMTNHYGTSRTYCTGVYDNQNNRELKNASQVITELNALHEENVKLQARNKYLATKIQRERNSTQKQYAKWEKEAETKIKELSEENEQLKKRNDRQAKQLDRLYNLIEEKDWRTLTDILDDFKRCEEQLQKEWGTYGDVE